MAGAIASVAAPLLLRAFDNGPGGADYDSVMRWFQSQNPQGSLSPQDYAAAEGTRKSLTDQADRTGVQNATLALRRAQQRGMAESPSTETTLAQLAEGTGAQKERAGETADQQLYNTWLGNKNFQRQGIMAQLNARLGGAARDQGYKNLRDSTFYNSMLDLGGSVLDHLGVGGGGGDTAPTPAPMNPDGSYIPPGGNPGGSGGGGDPENSNY